MGAVIPVETLFDLATRWYAGRLAPAWTPRSRAESQSLLEAAGLRGPFWSLSGAA